MSYGSADFLENLNRRAQIFLPSEENRPGTSNQYISSQRNGALQRINEGVGRMLGGSDSPQPGTSTGGFTNPQPGSSTGGVNWPSSSDSDEEPQPSTSTGGSTRPKKRKIQSTQEDGAINFNLYERDTVIFDDGSVQVTARRARFRHQKR